MKTSSLISGRKVMQFSLLAEGATGLAAVLAPDLVAQLIFGSDVAGAGAVYGRLLGIGLLALVIACWPGAGVISRPVVHALLFYNLLAPAYLAYLGAAQLHTGLLLWPAVAEHALVALLLAVRWPTSSSRRPP